MVVCVDEILGPKWKRNSKEEKTAYDLLEEKVDRFVKGNAYELRRGWSVKVDVTEDYYHRNYRGDSENIERLAKEYRAVGWGVLTTYGSGRVEIEIHSPR